MDEPLSLAPSARPHEAARDHRVHIVFGLGFGDEGKGSVVDFLVRSLGALHVVRFNGGPQAGHNVVTVEGAHHGFAQFGAGTFVAGVRTWLAAPMAVDLLALAREDVALRAVGVADAFGRLTVDARCPLVTPWHRAVNRLRERARGDARHGSCGRGVAETLLDAERDSVPVVRAGDLRDGARLRDRLRQVALVKLDLAEQLADRCEDDPGAAQELAAVRDRRLVDQVSHDWRAVATRIAIDDGEGLTRALRGPDRVVFEGAQGLLLDRDRGFWPHVTPSRTGPAAAAALLAEATPAARAWRVGVLRAYATRHGAGPFPTEDATFGATVAPCHNQTNAWQGPVRIGAFDAVLARYAVAATGGVDGVALTSIDRLAGRAAVPWCGAYEEGGARRDTLPCPPVPTQADQASLAAALEHGTPVVEALPGWPAFGPQDPLPPALGAFLERLPAPAALVSCGPTAAEKRWVP